MDNFVKKDFKTSDGKFNITLCLLYDYETHVREDLQYFSVIEKTLKTYKSKYLDINKNVLYKWVNDHCDKKIINMEVLITFDDMTKSIKDIIKILTEFFYYETFEGIYGRSYQNYKMYMFDN